MEKKPTFKPRRNILGINNWIKGKTAKTSEAQNFGRMFFKTILFAAPYTKVPLLGDAILKVAAMTEKDHTAGYTLPLNVDLSNRLDQSTLPIDLMKKVVKDSSYRAIIKTCMCRETFTCKEYPRDLGCLFIGRGAHSVVDNGIAVEASLEECYAHIDRAATLGLAGKAFWVEAEEYVWGVKDEDIQNFLEICFCCPCCCAAFNFDRNANRTSLTLPTGWVAEVDSNCVKCGACIKACPTNMISIGNSSIVIAENCSGCGLCIDACSKQKALKLVQKRAMKEDVKEYFDGLNLVL